MFNSECISVICWGRGVEEGEGRIKEKGKGGGIKERRGGNLVFNSECISVIC